MPTEHITQWLKHIFPIQKQWQTPKNHLFPRASENTTISQILKRLKTKCFHSSAHSILQLAKVFHSCLPLNIVLDLKPCSSCTYHSGVPVPHDERGWKMVATGTSLFTCFRWHSIPPISTYIIHTGRYVDY